MPVVEYVDAGQCQRLPKWEWKYVSHIRIQQCVQRWLRRTRVASMSVRGRCDNVGDDCGRAWSEVVRSLAMADYVSP